MTDNPRACPWCGNDDWQEAFDGKSDAPVLLHDLTDGPLVAMSEGAAEIVAASIFHSIDECRRCGCVVSL